MSTALIEVTKKLAERLNISGPAEDIFAVLKATAFKGSATDAQMSALMIVATQYGLNPWTKEIYAFPDKHNGIVPVVGVDGWSRIINSHHAFDGIEFRQSEIMLSMTGAKTIAPEWMEAVIYRKDRTRPIVVREYLDETYKPPTKKDGYVIDGPWQSHTKRFLRHKTLIQGARIAFGFSGIYDQDEAERIIDVGGNVPYCAAVDTSSIDSAETIHELQSAFAAAWKATSDKAIRESLTRAKDKRKKALQEADIIDVDMSTGEVIGHD